MSAEHFPETALDGAKAHIQELVQHHADSVYRTVLDSVQDYLIDNAQFNIGQKIATAKRGEKDALAKVAALESEKAELLEAAERALNYIASTEAEMGETMGCGDLLRAAIAKATGGAS